MTGTNSQNLKQARNPGRSKLPGLRRRFVSILAVFLAFGAPVVEAADLIGVRFGPNKNETRVVFDLSGKPSYAVSGDKSGKGRLIVDFAELSTAAKEQNYQPGKGHIGRYGFAKRADGGVRAFLDLKETAKIKEVFLIEPKGAVKKYRLVVDLQSADMKEFLASLPNQYPDLTAMIEQATSTNPPATETVRPAPPSQKEATQPNNQTQQVADLPARKLTIVVDAGHGGVDPGSQGQSGTLEKNVTLQAAIALRDIMNKRGRYNIVLTRSSDKKIKVDKREELARKAGADLFISLHADALTQHNVRGGSVYTLSKQGTERSAKIAKSQSDYQVYDLDVAAFGDGARDILFDVAQDKTKTASSKLAEVLVKKLTGKTPMLNRSHRTADLRVLLAPDVPAVLVEMGFISNAKDEANLNSKVWRKRTMTAIADAIDTYFDEHHDQVLVANRAPGGK